MMEAALPAIATVLVLVVETPWAMACPTAVLLFLDCDPAKLTRLLMAAEQQEALDLVLATRFRAATALMALAAPMICTTGELVQLVALRARLAASSMSSVSRFLTRAASRCRTRA